MNELDRKVAQILIEELEERFPGSRWVARPATPRDRFEFTADSTVTAHDEKED